MARQRRWSIVVLAWGLCCAAAVGQSTKKYADEIERARDRIADYTAQQTKLNAELQKLTAEAAEADAQVAQFEQQVAAAHNSLTDAQQTLQQRYAEHAQAKQATETYREARAADFRTRSVMIPLLDRKKWAEGQVAEAERQALAPLEHDAAYQEAITRRLAAKKRIAALKQHTDPVQAALMQASQEMIEQDKIVNAKRRERLAASKPLAQAKAKLAEVDRVIADHWKQFEQELASEPVYQQLKSAEDAGMRRIDAQKQAIDTGRSTLVASTQSLRTAKQQVAQLRFQMRKTQVEIDKVARQLADAEDDLGDALDDLRDARNR